MGGGVWESARAANCIRFCWSLSWNLHDASSEGKGRRLGTKFEKMTGRFIAVTTSIDREKTR